MSESSSKHVFWWLVIGTCHKRNRFARALCGSQWWASTSWHSNWLERKGFGRFLRKQSERSWCFSHTWILDSKELVPFLEALTSPVKLIFVKRPQLLKQKAWPYLNCIGWLIEQFRTITIWWMNFLRSPTLSWLPTYQRSVRAPQDASNVPAVEPSLADAKPADATEAVEVPWTCGWIMRTATNEYKW